MAIRDVRASDAVRAWAEQQSAVPVSAPREVYFADFVTAAAGDLVCDVAQPME
jgi:hypothetical protein